MAIIPIEHGLMLAAILFCIGLVGLLVRRNILYMLMSVEIMLNAAGLAFIVAGARWSQPVSAMPPSSSALRRIHTSRPSGALASPGACWRPC